MQLQVRLEEQHLFGQHGEVYATYCQKCGAGYDPCITRYSIHTSRLAVPARVAKIAALLR